MLNIYFKETKTWPFVRCHGMQTPYLQLNNKTNEHFRLRFPRSWMSMFSSGIKCLQQKRCRMFPSQRLISGCCPRLLIIARTRLIYALEKLREFYLHVAEIVDKLNLLFEIEAVCLQLRHNLHKMLQYECIKYYSGIGTHNFK